MNIIIVEWEVEMVELSVGLDSGQSCAEKWWLARVSDKKNFKSVLSLACRNMATDGRNTLSSTRQQTVEILLSSTRQQKV